jgi:signal transduction histidine kinase
MKKFAVALFVTAAAGLAFGAPLAERKKKCEDLVNKAIAHCQKVGAKKCFADISDSKGALVDGEFYVFGYDFAGSSVAHGHFKERVGKNFLNASDPNGVKTVLEYIKVDKPVYWRGEIPWHPLSSML